MKLTPIPNFSNLGVYVDGLDFQNLSVDEWVDLKTQLYSKYLLIIFRNTNLSLIDYTSRIGQWGKQSSALKHFLRKYDIPVGELPAILNDLRKVASSDISMEDYDTMCMLIRKRDILSDQDAVVIKLIGNSDAEYDTHKSVMLNGELAWHQDESMDVAFSEAIALFGNRSMTNSATGFLTTNPWYENQTETFRSELDDMIATHTYQPTMFNKNLDPIEERVIECSTGFDSNLPLIINTAAGFKGLHYSPSTITGIVGMSDAESKSLFKYINKTLFVDEYIHDHWYQQDNDLLIFDNSITMHRRLGTTLGRIAYRSPFYFRNPVADRYFQQEYQEKYNHIMSKFN